MRTRSPETQNRHLRRDMKKLAASIADMRRELGARRLYGRIMASLCCRLSQSERIPDEYKNMMRESYKQWDAIKCVEPPR